MKAFLWERDLLEEIPKTETKIPVYVKLANTHDLARAHAYFRSPLRKDEALKRLSGGDLCFIVVWNGSIVGYMWASLKRKIFIRELEREMILESGGVYLYEAFVLAGFRRKGLLKKMLEEALRYFASRGVSRAQVLTLTANAPPQRVLRHAGFNPIKLVKVVQIFRFTRFEERELESSPLSRL